jgi:hypothetical protein
MEVEADGVGEEEALDRPGAEAEAAVAVRDVELVIRCE